MSHPNGPQPPVPPYGPPPQGWGPPPPQVPPTPQHWSPQGPGGYPQQSPYGAPQWVPPSPDGGNGGSNRRRNLVLLVVGAAVALALIVAAVVVGVSVIDKSSDPNSDSTEPVSSASRQAGGSDGGGEPMTERAVGDLTAALEAQEGWSCYTTVAGALVRCHSFVAGEDPQRATLRVDLADGVVTNVDLAAYLVTDPAAVTAVAAQAVGETLFDGLGDELTAAAAADTDLGPDDLGTAATFTAYGDGFQIRSEGAEAIPGAGPSPGTTATLAPTLAAKGFTCKKDDAESISCEKDDGRTSVHVLGMDHETSTSWNLSVRGATYDTPLDEKQARAALGLELVGLGLSDEAGSSWVAAAAERQEGDFAGYSLELAIYSTGADASMMASVRQVR
ncbi:MULTISPECIES: hypothetical protein [Mumia]|uniref:hypothetical protein n=1 Tax=Mumia TaxID=1546255 RepID=UPI001421D2FE|nr:hypothetical protein [Mumia sp. ZJ1417]QMW65182.1 hypothetical protein H4N58_13285 [Mumia sp. ZJ1417]